MSRIFILDDSFSGRKRIIARDEAKIQFILFSGANFREIVVIITENHINEA